MSPLRRELTITCVVEEPDLLPLTLNTFLLMVKHETRGALEKIGLDVKTIDVRGRDVVEDR